MTVHKCLLVETDKDLLKGSSEWQPSRVEFNESI